mmetsp:Transcript_1026/g.2183  ORF Transcript_1026/g.2183 Transcript_1026/m.2183 type:complete len:92 (-) Transcript_1026:164-439(-)
MMDSGLVLHVSSSFLKETMGMDSPGSETGGSTFGLVTHKVSNGPTSSQSHTRAWQYQEDEMDGTSRLIRFVVAQEYLGQWFLGKVAATPQV